MLYHSSTVVTRVLNPLFKHLSYSNKSVVEKILLFAENLMIFSVWLQESKFQRLVKKSFPRANFSDVHQALQFVKFLMRTDAADRPDAARAKKHLFLKMISNPFLRDQYDRLQQVSPTSNPFKKVTSLVEVDPLCEGDVPASEILTENAPRELYPEKGTHPIFVNLYANFELLM